MPAPPWRSSKISDPFPLLARGGAAVRKGGGLAGTLLDANAVRALAELPSLDELRARIVGLLNAPASRLVGVLQAPGAQVARVLQAFADKAAA